jgi:hypothetical protein
MRMGMYMRIKDGLWTVAESQVSSSFCHQWFC